MYKKSVFFLIATLVILCVAILSFSKIPKAQEKKVVYAIYPMTGSFAEGGKNAKLITDMYFRSHPQSKLEIKYVDSESNPIKAVSAINQAIVSDDDPLAISVITSVSASCIPALANKNGFAISVCSLKTKQFDKFENCQFLSYDVADIAALPARYLARKSDSCAVIYSNEEYGMTGSMAFKQAFEKLGKKVCVTIPYMIGEASSREIVEKVMLLKVDSVYIVGVTTTGYLNIFRDLKGKGFRGTIASDIVFSSPFIYQALASVADGVVFVCCDCDLDDPRTKEGMAFRQACLSNNIIPYYGLVEIYDALLISDIFVQSNRSFTQESFLEMGVFNGCLGEVRCYEKGEAQYSFVLATIKDGKIVPVEE